MLDKLKELVSPLAPMIGSMLGGPAGAAVGVMLKKTLCDNEQASDEEFIAALQNPESLVKLKELNNQLEMAYVQADTQDRDSARKMHMELKNKMPAVLTSLLTIMVAYVFTLMFFCDIDPDMKSVLDYSSGQLFTAWIASIYFWFGSSHGSRNKDTIINGLNYVR